MILTEHQKVYLHKVAHDNGFFFSGKYGFHQQAFFVFSVLNEMPWKWCSAARGSGSVLAFVCQDRRIVQLFPCLANLLAQGGCKAFVDNIPPALRDFIAPRLESALQEDSNYLPPMMTSFEKRGVHVPPLYEDLPSSDESFAEMSVTTQSTPST